MKEPKKRKNEKKEKKKEKKNRFCHLMYEEDINRASQLRFKNEARRPYMRGGDMILFP